MANLSHQQFDLRKVSFLTREMNSCFLKYRPENIDRGQGQFNSITSNNLTILQSYDSKTQEVQGRL